MTEHPIDWAFSLLFAGILCLIAIVVVAIVWLTVAQSSPTPTPSVTTGAHK